MRAASSTLTRSSTNSLERTRIDAHSVAAQKLLFIQDICDRFGVEVTLALKVTVEAAPCEPRIGHNVVDRHGIEAMARAATVQPLRTIFCLVRWRCSAGYDIECLQWVRKGVPGLIARVPLYNSPQVARVSTACTIQIVI
jgi:hypothetical protein